MSVSTATRLFGSSRSSASRIESLMASAILSGWPSVTDSDVNRRRDTGLLRGKARADAHRLSPGSLSAGGVHPGQNEIPDPIGEHVLAAERHVVRRPVGREHRGRVVVALEPRGVAVLTD